jgi:glucose/mannose transport system substrate-binding protein
MRRESGASTGFIGRRAFAITCLASALLAGGVGACGSTAAAPTDTPAPPEPTLAAPTSMPSPTGSTMPATATSPPLMAETPRQPVTLSVYSAWAPGSVDDYYLRQLATHFKDELGYVTAITVQHSANAAEIGINIGDPPDAFAVDIGWELFMRWVTAGQMAPLDDVYEHEGLMQAFPKGVVDLASFDGHVWAVPLSVARSNVLWYDRTLLSENGIRPEDLTTFSGWEAAARKLQALGITPLAFGDAQPWASWQLFETVLEGTLGPAMYAGLWNGKTDWRGPEVTQALQNFNTLLRYTNSNHARIEWDQAYGLVIQRKAAMYIMGDWMLREFSNGGYGDYGWTAPPGTAGTFIMWPDGFSLPREARHADAAKQFLAYLASREAQQTFNQRRGAGAICARIDCDYSNFGPYNRSSAADFRVDALVPSVARAMWDSEGWTTDFQTALTDYLRSGNMAAAQSDLASACIAAKICR